VTFFEDLKEEGGGGGNEISLRQQSSGISSLESF